MAFADALLHANTAISGMFSEAITVDSVSGVGVLTPSADLMLGGGVQLFNGMKLSILDADFPGLAVNSTVTHNGQTYIVAELDRSVDPYGWRHALLAKS